MHFVPKLFSTSIDVKDPVEFCTNIDRHTLMEIRNRFKGTCYKGAYIVEVTRIVRISSCKICTTNLEGDGVVDVLFEGLVASLGRWDLVAGLRVRNKNLLYICDRGDLGEARNVKIIATLIPTVSTASIIGNDGAPDGAVAKSKADALQVLKIGQKITMRVSDVRCNYMSKYITVVGSLFTCDTTSPAFRVEGDLTAADAARLAPVVDAIRAELVERNAALDSPSGPQRGASRDMIWFIERICYSYANTASDSVGDVIMSKNGPAWAGPARLIDAADSAEIVNMLDLVAGAPFDMSGIWCRDLSIYRSSPLVAKYVGDSPPWEQVLVESPTVVAQIMLMQMLNYLTAVREMTTIYAESKEENGNIWEVMRHAQLPLPSQQ